MEARLGAAAAAERLSEPRPDAVVVELLTSRANWRALAAAEVRRSGRLGEPRGSGTEPRASAAVMRDCGGDESRATTASSAPCSSPLPGSNASAPVAIGPGSALSAPLVHGSAPSALPSVPASLGRTTLDCRLGPLPLPLPLAPDAPRPEVPRLGAPRPRGAEAGGCRRRGRVGPVSSFEAGGGCPAADWGPAPARRCWSAVATLPAASSAPPPAGVTFSSPPAGPDSSLSDMMALVMRRPWRETDRDLCGCV